MEYIELDALNGIKARLLAGELTYNEAKAKAQPFIDLLNDKGKRIAKKHKRRFAGFSFTSFMR